MIRQIYQVVYNDSVGYAENEEEARQMEERFKARYNMEPITSIAGRPYHFYTDHLAQMK